MPSLTMPTLVGSPRAAGRVVTWIVDDGAWVDEWDPVASIELAGLEIELLAPADGRIRKQAAIDRAIPANGVVAVVENDEHDTPLNRAGPAQPNPAPADVSYQICDIDVTMHLSSTGSPELDVRVVDAVVHALVDMPTRDDQEQQRIINIEMINAWSSPARVFIDNAAMLSPRGLAVALTKSRKTPTQGVVYISITNQSAAYAFTTLPVLPAMAVCAFSFSAPRKSPAVITDPLGQANLAVRSMVRLTIAYSPGALTDVDADHICRRVSQRLCTPETRTSL